MTSSIKFFSELCGQKNLIKNPNQTWARFFFYFFFLHGLSLDTYLRSGHATWMRTVRSELNVAFSQCILVYHCLLHHLVSAELQNDNGGWGNWWFTWYLGKQFKQNWKELTETDVVKSLKTATVWVTKWSKCSLARWIDQIWAKNK